MSERVEALRLLVEMDQRIVDRHHIRVKNHEVKGEEAKYCTNLIKESSALLDRWHAELERIAFQPEQNGIPSWDTATFKVGGLPSE